VLEDLGGDHPVEGTVGEGESEGVALDRPHPGRLAIELAGRPHGLEGVPDIADLL
jgi:hypothetical protein